MIFHSPNRQMYGFTLIELLLVIGIIAILATVIVLIINPANILSESRDSRRAAEIHSLAKGISLFQAGGSDKNLGNPNTVYVSLPSTQADCSDLGLPPLHGGWSYHCVAADALRKVDGTGWIPIDFSSLLSSINYSTLPVDPVNSSKLYYVYIPGYELTARLESEKYLDVIARNDGGSDYQRMEQGTDLALWAEASPQIPRAELAWDPATDNVGVVGYKVLRSTMAGGPYTEIASTPDLVYVDTEVNYATTYYYIVEAYDLAGNVSDPSQEVQAVIP